uniref:NADH:quinone oxidoreductase/Mrp antiporter membrane subunit domain-containing protein n=1 Tax=Solanum lycopersicum TaxID=4081 RepID=K4B4H3_SOLLC
MDGIAIQIPKMFTMFNSFSRASLALPDINSSKVSFFDSGPPELFLSIFIFLHVIGTGIYPNFVLSLALDKVKVILSSFFL